MKIIIFCTYLISIVGVVPSAAYKKGLQMKALKEEKKARCLLGDFEEQVECRLQKMMSPEQVEHAKSTCKRVEHSLRSRWKDSEVIPIGSTTIGLAMVNSDIDCHVIIPGFNTSVPKQTLEEISEILSQYPTMYYNLTTKTRINTGETIHIWKFFDNVNQRKSQFTIIDYSSSTDCRIRAYYLSLDSRYLQLAALIKFWIRAKPRKLFPKRLMYSLELMVIFYLQQKNLAPPFYQLEVKGDDSHFESWDIPFKEVPYSSTADFTLYELLGDFFKFYAEFNFQDYVISPYFGRPVLKAQFNDINTLPEEFVLYKNYLKLEDSIPLYVNSTICVQELLIHRRNPMGFYNEENANRLISEFRNTAKMFEELPRDEVLKNII